MNMKDIKALAAVLRQADLTKLEYSEGDLRITLERTAPGIVTLAQQPSAYAVPEAAAAPVAEEKNDFNNLSEVKAPMVGVFYASPAPDAKPFVRVGDTVEKGQVICIIEAMKLMNDITAPVSGRIVDICALDGAVLEYGQTIMKIV
jgi:acetyl-CoA carboxylase biotin carboxyl carrier protein